MPGENLLPKVSRLTGDVGSLEARLRRMETLLEQFRPQFLQIKDINGKLRRYSALARFEGTTQEVSPFLLITRTIRGQIQAGVTHDSKLFLSLRPDDFMDLENTLDKDLTNGWINLNSSDAIYLETSFDRNAEVTTAKVTSWGNTGDFRPGASAWTSNAFVEEQTIGGQTFHSVSRKIIGYTFLDDEGELLVNQQMFRHQLLRNICIDGKTARYPFDHEGGYPL
jgi:hypothetical protein